MIIYNGDGFELRRIDMKSDGDEDPGHMEKKGEDVLTYLHDHLLNSLHNLLACLFTYLHTYLFIYFPTYLTLLP